MARIYKLNRVLCVKAITTSYSRNAGFVKDDARRKRLALVYIEDYMAYVYIFLITIH